MWRTLRRKFESLTEAPPLLQISVEPFQPDSLSVRLVHRITRVVSSRGNGDELHGDAVVLERVVHRVGIGDGHAGGRPCREESTWVS
jgi:hypothetical protein